MKYWLYNQLVMQELRQVSCTVEIHCGCLTSQRMNVHFCTHILVLLLIIGALPNELVLTEMKKIINVVGLAVRPNIFIENVGD